MAKKKKGKKPGGTLVGNIFRGVLNKSLGLNLQPPVPLSDPASMGGGAVTVNPDEDQPHNETEPKTGLGAVVGSILSPDKPFADTVKDIKENVNGYFQAGKATTSAAKWIKIAVIVVGGLYAIKLLFGFSGYRKNRI